LPKEYMISKSFLMEFVWSFRYRIISSTNRYILNSSLPIWIPFISCSCFKLKSFMHFELILVQGERKASGFSLLMWISSYPINICWRGCFFSIECLGVFCWKSVGYNCMSLCLSLLF
jgi:hypothetical protein